MMISSDPYGIPLSADISVIHYWDAKKKKKF